MWVDLNTRLMLYPSEVIEASNIVAANRKDMVRHTTMIDAANYLHSYGYYYGIVEVVISERMEG